MLTVTLSYTMCSCSPWKEIYNPIGEFTLRERKTTEQVQAEKAFNKEKGINKKINPYTYERNSTFSIKGDTCYFLLGSWHKLKEAFEENGEEYEIVDKRDKSLMPEPDYSAIADVDFRPGQMEAIALMLSQDGGILCSTVGFGKSFCLKQLCKLYPTLNILVVCPAGEVVRELYRDINAELPGQVGLLNMDNSNVSGKRIIVTTTKSMNKVKPEQVQLLLFDECHGVGYNTTGSDVMKFCFCRRFGFTATPTRNQGDLKYMEAIFGPTLQELSFQEVQHTGGVTPIVYTMLPVGKRLPYLCDLVQVIDAQGTEAYRERGKLNDGDIPTGKTKKRDIPDYLKQQLYYMNNKARDEIIVDAFNRAKDANPDRQILIMVSSIAHLIRIHKRIPYLAIAHGERGSLDRYKGKKDLANVDMSKYKQSAKDAEIVKRAFEKGTLKYAISTGVWSKGINVKHLTTLIRADGATSSIPSIQIPGRLARLDENKPTAYLIDVADDFCEDAERRASKREETYKKEGWTNKSFHEILEELKGMRDVQ